MLHKKGRDRQQGRGRQQAGKKARISGSRRAAQDAPGDAQRQQAGEEPTGTASARQDVRESRSRAGKRARNYTFANSRGGGVFTKTGPRRGE